ncbi:hypothetical protein RJ55_01067 [Drechmeria coniospora]|nr:hypothetical protein RJ55_01067 [Drechmeria coniospora]
MKMPSLVAADESRTHQTSDALPGAEGTSSEQRISWPSPVPLPPTLQERSRRSPSVRLSPSTLPSSASSSAVGTADQVEAFSIATPPGTRNRSPPDDPGNDVDFTVEWGGDNPTDGLSVLPSGRVEGCTLDEHHLSALAESDFSSPSSYPSFLNPRASADPCPDQVPGQVRQPVVTNLRSSTPPPHSPSSAHDRANVSLSRSTTLCSTTSAREPQNALDPTKVDDEPRISPTQHSPFPEMPSSQTPGAHPCKKRRGPETSKAKVSKESTAIALPDLLSDDDLFGENEHAKSKADVGELATIDLTSTNEVPEELTKPATDNRVKLSAFQCVICMDDVTTLTVTHCGHLFCQQCLHSSLHVDTTRGKCPMCRAKIDMKARPTYNRSTKGFWPLELKLMTAAKKGKRKADQIT